VNYFSTVLNWLTWQDWIALAWFFCAWVGYAFFARKKSTEKHSLLVLTNRERRNWMLASIKRDNRVIDGVVVQSLVGSPSFFASTTILIIGGLLAVLGTTDKATEFVKEIPFAVRTTALLFDLKLFLLLGIFVYAFFRFTWSQRLYSFGALLVGAAPECQSFTSEDAREAWADRAGKVMAMAAETFNDGLRAYYLAFAAIGWFVSPLMFGLGTAGVLVILYRREFKSDVLAILASDQKN
jgi:uncharacterized membrane protein